MSKKQKQNLWIAKNKNGSLFIYNGMPTLDSSGMFHTCDGGNSLQLNGDLFPDVTFENSPQPVSYFNKK
jgi:hypothetical protein